MSLYLLILWPLFCAYAVRYIPRGRRFEKNSLLIGEAFAVIGAAAELLLISFLMTENMTSSLPLFGGYGLSLSFTGINALCCLLTALTWLITVLLTRPQIRASRDPGLFYFYFFLALSALIGYFISSSFFTLFLFFGLISLFTYPLLEREGGRPASIFIASSLISGALILAGMLLLYSQIGSLSYGTVYTFSGLVNRPSVMTAGVLMLVGFLSNTVLFPLNMCRRGAPSAPCLALTAIYSLTGIYGIFNISLIMFPSSALWSGILMFVGCAVMLSGAFFSMLSSALDRMLLFSVLAQSGTVIIGLSSLVAGDYQYAAAGCVLHIFSSTIALTLLLGISSVICYTASTASITYLTGFGHKSHLLNFVFLSASLGLSGIPVWSGYISRSLIGQSLLDNGFTVCCAVFIASGGFTAAALVRAYVLIFLKRPARDFEKDIPTENLSVPALVLPSLLLPAFGIMPNTTAALLVNYVLPRLRVEKLGYVRYLSSNMLSAEFITVVFGGLLYMLLVKFSKPYSPEADRPDFWEGKLLPFLRERSAKNAVRSDSVSENLSDSPSAREEISGKTALFERVTVILCITVCVAAVVCVLINA